MTDFRQGTIANPVNIGPFRQIVKIEGKKKPSILGGAGSFHWGGPILGEFTISSGFSTLGGFNTPETDPPTGLNPGGPVTLSGDVLGGVDGELRFPVGGTYEAATTALVFESGLPGDHASAATIAILNADTGEVLASTTVDVPPGGNATASVGLSRRPVPGGHAAFGVTVGAKGRHLAIFFPSSTLSVTHYPT